MKKFDKLLKTVSFAITVVGLFVFFPIYVGADSTYGSGNYGDCAYSSCGIGITTSASVSLSITPSPSGVCRLNNDAVNIQTANSNGYTLTVLSGSGSNSLTNGISNITATAGTVASPTTLSNNTWGFRVDGQGGFGAGPTTGASDASAITFAGVPTNVGTPAAIATTSVPSAVGGDNIPVWYGACVDTSITNGTYSLTVTYTVVTNA